MMPITRCLVVAASLVFCTTVLAQETPPSDDADPAAAFQQKREDWITLLKNLRSLQQEYREADADRRAEIAKEFNDLADRGEVLEGELIDAAAAAYAADPENSPQAQRLLREALASAVAMDDYDTAYELGNTLLEAGDDSAEVHENTGVAAYALARFDEAARQFRKAQEAGQLGQQAAFMLQTIPDEQEKWTREKKLREQEAKADDLPRVLMKTSEGDIKLELFENEAPIAVGNFVSLVEDGYYDGITFHRVLPGFMAQGGCPDGTGTGGPGYNIPGEAHEPDARMHFRGSLSMALGPGGPDTGGSQFFLTFLPTPHLDGKHTVFGRVIEGMDVLPKLTRRDPQDPNAPKPSRIIDAKVLRKRDHEYEPKTVEEWK